MNNSELLAHAIQDEKTGEWRTHSLDEHLAGVAKMADEFAGVFGNGDWGSAAGFLHDLGKGSDAFQQYIRQVTGFDAEAHIETSPGKVNHSSHGAVWSVENLKGIGRILAYLVAGHHAGLPDWFRTLGIGGNLEHRLSAEEQKDLPQVPEVWQTMAVSRVRVPYSLPCGRSLTEEAFHLWVRMLFSSLVDADFLDTEEFMRPDQWAQRGTYPPLSELKSKFESYMDSLIAKAEPTEVNRLRQQILSECRDAGCKEPGFFSLTVPTGGGKTLSAMAFALEHAVVPNNNKKRIIVAIPYTSIIEQTAKEYKKIFGEENVVEHHSSLDPDKESRQSRLASENWDAPIIVTTNVQLFESLFAAKSSACRKLHNIADSIIILDEAQMLPPGYLRPIVSVMNSLVSYFRVSMVLCTATQPALTGRIGAGQSAFKGIVQETVREIMTNPNKLTRELQRVQVRVRENKVTDWAELARELAAYERVLCIVNTRNDCRELYRLMPEGTVHLSANMCGAHRSQVIAGIKETLHAKQPIRVISTQLVEAGVDIDFPVVYRAMGGFDSIAQAAGRCNREGRLDVGKVVVFEPPKAAPPGLLRKGADAGREILACDPDGCANLEPATFQKYFALFYGKVNSFDTKDMKSLLEQEARECKFQFREAAQKFHLIDDQQQIPVVVWFADEKAKSKDLIQKLRYSGPSKELMRKLQRFTITIPERCLVQAQYGLEKVPDEEHGIWCQAADGIYDQRLGFVGLNMVWNEDTFMC
ncbi:MAG: CRISPR-associated helicase Cas3' [Desulfobacteraceae bacterium]|nr:MAG: CRISPR-associated helicase Cas3' [Desulfobacteraceae bacterium]